LNVERIKTVSTPQVSLPKFRKITCYHLSPIPDDTELNLTPHNVDENRDGDEDGDGDGNGDGDS